MLNLKPWKLLGYIRTQGLQISFKPMDYWDLLELMGCLYNLVDARLHMVFPLHPKKSLRTIELYSNLMAKLGYIRSENNIQ
jgi:hypothetical protein